MRPARRALHRLGGDEGGAAHPRRLVTTRPWASRRWCFFGRTKRELATFPRTRNTHGQWQHLIGTFDGR